MTTTYIGLVTPESFRYMPTIWSHGWYQLAPFTFDEDTRSLTRIHELSDGIVVKLKITPTKDTSGLSIEVEGHDTRLSSPQQNEVIRVVKRILGLNHDLTPFYTWLRDKPNYAWVERGGVGRIMVSPTLWEDLVKTLMTTNTTWNMTKQMVKRVCALGTPYGEEFAFPKPEVIAAMSVEELDEKVRAGYRSAYLHELATEIANGLDIESWYDNPSTSDILYKRLRSLRGFGDYAVGTIMRLMNRYDRLSIDSECRAMFKQKYKNGDMPTDAEIRAYYEQFGDWRGMMQWMDMLATWFGVNENEKP